VLRYEIKNLFATQPSILYFSFLGLEPDGCLVADQFRIRTKTFENAGAGKEKGLIRLLDDVPAKKNVLFCDGVVFFLDRRLLMGAKIFNQSKLHISYGYPKRKPHLQYRK